MLALFLQEGLICTEAAAPCCVLCDARVPEAIGVSAAGLSTRDLPHEAIQLGADVSWCLERSELEAVYLRAKQVRQRLATCTHISVAMQTPVSSRKLTLANADAFLSPSAPANNSVLFWSSERWFVVVAVKHQDAWRA